MRFRNPQNNYEKKANYAWLWCLLFGGIYFVVRRLWAHALLWLMFLPMTYGISWGLAELIVICPGRGGRERKVAAFSSSRTNLNPLAPHPLRASFAD
jgi:hypothetical protein